MAVGEVGNKKYGKKAVQCRVLSLLIKYENYHRIEHTQQNFRSSVGCLQYYYNNLPQNYVVIYDGLLSKELNLYYFPRKQAIDKDLRYQIY